MRKQPEESGTFPGWGSEGHSPAWPGLEQPRARSLLSDAAPLAAQNSTGSAPPLFPSLSPGPSRPELPNPGQSQSGRVRLSGLAGRTAGTRYAGRQRGDTARLEEEEEALRGRTWGGGAEVLEG